MKIYSKHYFLILILIITTDCFSRSVHRPVDPTDAYITVKYENDKDTYSLKSQHLREFPLFKTYNHQYFMSKQLPSDKIYFRDNPTEFVDGKKLNEIIKKLLVEIRKRKTNYTDFKVLKERDFNHELNYGLIVLKFKNYPFVFKLFIETPESFVRPIFKPFQVRGIFFLGGAFRHISGWTRIRNADLIREKMKDHPVWSQRIDLPRKWFWLPEDPRWLILKGYNLGDKKEQETRIPAIYGIVCDEIKSTQNNSAYEKEYFKFCNYIEFIQDPNVNNFKIDKNNKIVLIDTEHFATLLGFTEKMRYFKSYNSYYSNLAGKYIRERWTKTKKDRKKRQFSTQTYYPLF
jgi:hypothetical protein